MALVSDRAAALLAFRTWTTVATMATASAATATPAALAFAFATELFTARFAPAALAARLTLARAAIIAIAA